MESTKISKENISLIRLLGYLTEKQWADAINNLDVDKDLAFDLIRIQDERYNGNLEENVKLLL